MHKRSLTAFACIAAMTATVAACSSSGSASSASANASKQQTLTVWYMTGDLSSTTIAAIDKAFTAETGAKVNVQIQQWQNINTKITTALTQSNPPDVLELGNTDVPLFAANGGLTDLTPNEQALEQGQSWLAGLAGPATVNGHVYAAPLFAGNRAVIYNKKIWSAADVTTVPTSYAELLTDLNKVKAANAAKPGFSAFYFPGEYWYGALQWVWDAGGQLASQSGGKWQGDLTSAAAQQGLAAWKSFQNTYSTPASRNTDTTTPDFNVLFAQGKTSAILNSSVNTILTDNPALKDEIGTFPMPSVTSGSTQPVFLGGSDLAVSAKSANQALALKYLEVAASQAVQSADIVGVDHWTPISTQLISSTSAELPTTSQAFTAAAKNSVATPATPGWATIESDSSINSFFADIAAGRKSPMAAATSFDSHLDQALNAAP
jgi:N,N'-diacetylchitobiose transport system substrate-binding protein